MAEEKSKDGFVLGLAIGGVIGAAAAFLLDKEDAQKIKKLLTKKGKVLLDNLEEVTEEGQEKLSETITDIKEQVQNIPPVITDKVEEVEKSGKTSLRRFFVKAGKKLAK